jgi:dTMP kinase
MAVLQNFAVFEGPDGSGTSTQLEILRRRFERLALEGGGVPRAVFTAEPTDGEVGLLLRRALRGEVRLRGETAAYLFAADRYEHLYGEGGLVQALGRGAAAVCDRYILSSLVYQGIECGDELPAVLNRGFPAPELLLFFDVDSETSLARLEKRTRKDVYERPDFQRLVRERYLALLDSCRQEGSRVAVIDAAAGIEAVSEAVWKNIRLLPIMKGCTG